MFKLTGTGRILLGLIGVALSLLLALSSVGAADITVGKACTLADAISAANADDARGGCPAGEGADTIWLTGDVTLAAELPFIESEITIEGNGYAISGDLSHRIFSVGDTAFTLNYVTLKDGRAPFGGAAIESLGSAKISLSFSRLEGNVVFGTILDFGGAINFWPCDLVITNSVFRDNTASGDGGAIFFSECCGETLHISDSVFEKNNAENGGAIYIGALHPEQTATIVNSAFADNWVTRDGGAIYRNGQSDKSSGQLIISNSTFYGNESRSGGALFLDRNTLITLGHVTLVDNNAIYGSSIYADERGITELYSSIAGGNYLNQLCYGALSIASHSIIEDGSCDSPLELDASLGELIEPADGSPGYFPLLPGSPAIDAVDCDRGIPIDQIGTPRPQGAACDIGALEYVPPVDADE